MKSPSLDTFYTKLDKIILLAESYTEIEGLSDIIRACRLKPYSLFFEKKDYSIVLHRWWFDEFGNSMKITKNKKIKIIYGDLSIDRNKIVCTDLYYGLSVNKMAKISKMLHMFTGKDEDTYQDCAILSFWGIDNYIRSYMYLYDEWKVISPLYLGMHNLKRFVRNRDIKYFLDGENKKNMPIPCISAHEWLTFLPPSRGFLSDVNKQFDKVIPIIEEKINE